MLDFTNLLLRLSVSAGLATILDINVGEQPAYFSFKLGREALVYF